MTDPHFGSCCIMHPGLSRKLLDRMHSRQASEDQGILASDCEFCPRGEALFVCQCFAKLCRTYW